MNEIALIVNRYQRVSYYIYLPTFTQLSLHLASGHQLPASNTYKQLFYSLIEATKHTAKTNENNYEQHPGTETPQFCSYRWVVYNSTKRVQPCRPLAFEQMIDDRLSDGARLLRTPCFLLHCPGYSIRGAIRLSIGLTVSVLRCLLPGPAATELLPLS